MQRNTSPRTEKDWFNISPAPHHSDTGTVSTITMKKDFLSEKKSTKERQASSAAETV